MGYRAWARVGSALLLATTLQFPAYAQSESVLNPSSANPTVVPVLNAAAQSALLRAVAGSQRIEPSRDRARNPAATLQFFGVRPTDTVIEIWPGQGWYTSILGPYLKQGSGTLIVGHFDAASTNSAVVRQIVDAYRSRFASDQGTYGAVSVVPFGPRSGPLGMPGSADSVLTFRNIHNWMAQGWAEKAFGDFFLVLKPGGILGIEEHRGRTDEPQDPLARDGYVREDFVIQLAREAGFEFVGRSEVNANPADTKDHPFGVWTLPPVSRTSPLGQRDDPGFDRTRYDAIGESDRMTLRFRKPLTATSAPPAPGTRWTPVIVAPASPAPPPTIMRPGQFPRAAIGATPIIAPPVMTSAPSTLRPALPIATTPSVTRSLSTPANPEATGPRRIDVAPAAVPVRILKPPLVISPPAMASQQAAQTQTSTPPALLPPASPPAGSPNTPLGPEPTPPPLKVETKPLEAIIAPAPLILPAAVPQIAAPLVSAPRVPTRPTRAARRAIRPSVAQAPPALVVVEPDAPLSTTPRARRTVRQRPVPTMPTRLRPAKPSAPPTTRASRESPVVAGPNRATPEARPAEARQVARPRPDPAPKPKVKTKSKAALPASPPRQLRRPNPPPVVVKKKTPSPPRDPNKPDWVVPRQRS